MSPKQFRQALGRFASGVTVVCAMDDGQPCGATVSAFCSVSLDPPLVLVSLRQTSRTCAVIRQSGVFAVNLLAARQRCLAQRFAGQGAREKTFTDIPHHVGSTHTPLFEEALACIECRLTATYPGGDHALLLGAVEAIECGDAVQAGGPLLYFRAAFRTLGPETTERDGSSRSI